MELGLKEILMALPILLVVYAKSTKNRVVGDFILRVAAIFLFLLLIGGSIYVIYYSLYNN